VAASDLTVVIAPSAFKGSLAARDVAEALAAGVRRVWPDARVELLPVSDGGEEWVQSMVSATAGSFVEVEVRGPLDEPVTARYGLIDSEGVMTAVIEMAAASGLTLVPRDRRDPRRASTYGTGELLLDALDRGARRLLVGIGGSATNDGGAGMAAALSVRLRARRRTPAAGWGGIGRPRGRGPVGA
jgi:glycerate kinase